MLTVYTKTLYTHRISWSHTYASKILTLLLQRHRIISKRILFILQYDQITLYTLQGKNSKPNTLKVKTFFGLKKGYFNQRTIIFNYLCFRSCSHYLWQRKCSKLGTIQAQLTKRVEKKTFIGGKRKGSSRNTYYFHTSQVNQYELCMLTRISLIVQRKTIRTHYQLFNITIR